MNSRDSASGRRKASGTKAPTRWSRRSLEELTDIYWTHLAPEREAEGYDPTTDRPSYRWLVDHGYGGIQYALREHHDLTVKEFFTEVVGVEDADDDSDAVHQQIAEYLDGLATRRELAESTLRSKRARLRKFHRVYTDIHDTNPIDAVVATEGRSASADQPAEIERVLTTLDAVADGLSTDASRLQYLGDAKAFYAFLVRRGYATYNPLADAGEEFPWERSEPDNPALTAGDVRHLHRTAESTDERLLVVGLAGWGLRPSELAGLHRDQIRLDPEDPHLSFETRKNGPGSVSLVYGFDALADRVADLDGDGWNGYLLPSAQSRHGHVTPDTVRNRFKRLARRADVSVEGEVPTPKMGRRFWYATYVDATTALLERLDDIASDQGSASPEVVRRNYLSEDRRRAARRRFMRDELATAFDR